MHQGGDWVVRQDCERQLVGEEVGGSCKKKTTKNTEWLLEY
jgi:hypothetical protein